MKIRFPFFRRNERQKLSWLSNIGYLMQVVFQRRKTFAIRSSFFRVLPILGFTRSSRNRVTHRSARRSTVSNKIGRASEANRESES